MMNAAEWTDLLYRALGIPDAVTDKAAAAARLTLEGAWKEPPNNTMDEQWRPAAVDFVLRRLPTLAAAGQLDELLMGWADADSVVTTLEQGPLKESGRTADTDRVKAVLSYLLGPIVTWVAAHRFAEGR